MTESLLAITILLLLGVLAFLLILVKRQGQGSNPEVENQLRSEIAGLQAQATERQAQAAARQAETAAAAASAETQARDLQKRLTDETGARRAAEASLAAERKNLVEQKSLLDQAETKLRDAFKALSADALKNSNAEFLAQAEQRLKPIRDLLGTYEGHLRDIEKIRADAYGGLKSHLENLALAHQSLKDETVRLKEALKSPTVRGRWGEVTLRRVVEVAGMSAYCDFEEQVSVAGDGDALQRPDMIVKLPNHRVIVVDSKVPLDAYLAAMDSTDDVARKAALVRHAQAVRSRVRALGQQSYWKQFQPAPDFVVLFLPGESFFSAALEQDHGLIEDGMECGVVLATPTTLIALLKAVAYGWRQEELAENAERIAEAGKQLYERICTFAEHLDGVGDGLRKAGKAYDKAVGSYERMLVPSARRLADLGAASGKDLPEMPTAEGPTRMLAPPVELPVAEPRAIEPPASA